MTASSVTGIGTGSAEGPLRGFDLDNIRRVFINQNGTLAAAAQLVDDKWILQSPLNNPTGAIILNGNTIQTTSDGNPRGTKAVDLQSCRNDAVQVASGNYSIISGGCGNIASGTYSFSTNFHNTSAGIGSASFGGFTVAVGTFAHSEGAHTIAASNWSHAEGDYTVAGNRPAPCDISGLTVTILNVDFTKQFPNGYSVTFYDLQGGTDNLISTAIRTISNSMLVGSDTVFNIDSAIGDRTGGFCVAPLISQAAHAEGSFTTASGYQSHAEGLLTLASGNHSHAGGSNSIADKSGQYASSNGSFALNGDAQQTNIVLFAPTTDATPTVLTTDSAPPVLFTQNLFFIDTDKTLTATVRVAARSAAGVDCAFFFHKCLIQNVAGTVSLVGTEQIVGTDIGSNAGAPPAGWTIAMVADNVNKALNIVATGVAATNIRWVCFLETVEVQYP